MEKEPVNLSGGDARNREPHGEKAVLAPGLEPAAQPEEAPVDAAVQVQLDGSYMMAQVLLTPPRGAGRPADTEMLEQALRGAGVVHGIDQEALQRLAEEPVYGRPVPVARGTSPVDGEDGVCEELFPREKTKQVKQREDGSVDYRELSLITDVKPGTVICNILAPKPGTPGFNVKGAELKPREGKKAAVPAGEGTQLSADGSRLEASIAGNLVFRSGRFAIETTYRVQNVDYEVGNITFSGDVVVAGDMEDGFEIHAGGNVTLRGRVGAVVIVAQNITFDQGVNGTGRARIEARDTVKSTFIENCTVLAAKRVVASSIINSTVECEGDVEVTSQKGLICGGKIIAFGSVRAFVVGNEFNTLTVITLGITPRLIAERKRLQDQLADVERHIDGMQKNVAYIERMVADNRTVPPERVQMLQRTQFQLPMSERKRTQLKASIASLEGMMSEVHNSTLTARIIHPPTKISIGSLSTNCIETRNNCRVYRSKEGELVFGSN